MARGNYYLRQLLSVNTVGIVDLIKYDQRFSIYFLIFINIDLY